MIVSPVTSVAAKAPPSEATVVEVGVETVKNHGLEIFVQCMYMVPVVGNAMSFYDVSVDICAALLTFGSFATANINRSS